MRKEILEKLSVITAEERDILAGKHEIDRSIYTDKGAFVIDRKKVLDEGALIRIRTHTRFISFPKHSHNYVEMVYMVSGETHHKVDDTPVTLKEGELLIMNQSATQEIEMAGEGDVAVNFIILPEFFDETLKHMGHRENPLRDFLISALTSNDSPVSYMHYRLSEVVPVQNLIENLIYSLLYGASDSETDALTMALLFMHLLKHTKNMRTDKNSYDKKLVFDAISYIDSRYRDASLSEFAKASHYELTALSRLIKKYPGFTWQEILQQKRIDVACGMLETTEVSVADISVAVGYENISYFHRLFRKYYGISPKHYRDHYR